MSITISILRLSAQAIYKGIKAGIYEPEELEVILPSYKATLRVIANADKKAAEAKAKEEAAPKPAPTEEEPVIPIAE